MTEVERTPTAPSLLHVLLRSLKPSDSGLEGLSPGYLIFHQKMSLRRLLQTAHWYSRIDIETGREKQVVEKAKSPQISLEKERFYQIFAAFKTRSSSLCVTGNFNCVIRIIRFPL